VDTDLSLAADLGRGFGFSPTHLWVNGASVVLIDGSSDISSLFDICRVMKVEVTIIPGTNTNDAASGASYVLPTLYEAFDPNDSTNPALNEIRQIASCRVHRADVLIRRTIYPLLAETNSLVSLGVSSQDRFVSTTNDIPAYGYKLFIDIGATAVATCRVSFKIFYDCRQSR